MIQKELSDNAHATVDRRSDLTKASLTIDPRDKHFPCPPRTHNGHGSPSWGRSAYDVSTCVVRPRRACWPGARRWEGSTKSTLGKKKLAQAYTFLFLCYVRMAHGPYMALACSMLSARNFLLPFASLIFAQSSACCMGSREKEAPYAPGLYAKKDCPRRCSSRGASGSSFSSPETSNGLPSPARSPSCCKMSASQPASLSGSSPAVGKKVSTSSKSSPRIPWAKEWLGERQAQLTSGKTIRTATQLCLQVPWGTSTGKKGYAHPLARKATHIHWQGMLGCVIEEHDPAHDTCQKNHRSAIC